LNFVVDTNVAVVANRTTNASLNCELACIEFLRDLLHRGRIYVDVQGEITAEYHVHLKPRGQPGVGDRFYFEVLQSAIKKVVRVDCPKDAATNEHVHFPSHQSLVAFDRSDRKFVAAAVSGDVGIAVAVDRGWLNHQTELAAQNIDVNYLCGTDRTRMFKP
jgi:hypothetical protein